MLFDHDDDKPREECGVVGVFGHPQASLLVALGLHALQHRGQEACGITTFDGERFHGERHMGLVGENFGGGPVGIETIAASLSEPRDAIEDIIEPYLIQQGFLQRTPRGRVLTPRAFEHMGLAVPGGLETRQATLFEEGEE